MSFSRRFLWATIYKYYLFILSKTVLRNTIRKIKNSGYFSDEEYIKCNPDVKDLNIDPAVHYILYGISQNRPIDCKKEVPKYQKEIIESYLPVDSNPEYEKEQFPGISDPAVKLIAFYLPQFHPFPENDKFWGKGFTEWTNVTKAVPLFEGHYQPRLPGELGFYDTRIKDVIKRQIELAKQYGIHGFCLHHYFFNGKAVMRVPFNQIMENKDLDIPFCLHWANEPWTAKFDGFGNQGGLLLEQKHSPQDDIAFFRDIEPALKDDRYIRIDGKPLLLIYRPGLFPNIKETAQRWRECALKSNLGDLFLAFLHTGFDGKLDPGKMGFDAAVEFPPHLVKYIGIRHELKLFDNEFPGYLCSYAEVVKRAFKVPPPNYTYFRGIFPNWDNTPRIKNAIIFHGSTPVEYEKWLVELGKYSIENLPKSQRLIFVNAWNEWAEGAYLEPDRKYGYAYLNATARALKKLNC